MSSDPDPVADSSHRHLRVIEAILFAAAEPVSESELAQRLPEGVNVSALIERLCGEYRDRGVELVGVAGKWMFRTARDLRFLLEKEKKVSRRLSRAALETLAIIAYHQPATRADIEEIRGAGLSRGTLDMLLETGWVRLRGRRQTPGRPVLYGVSEAFLVHFGLDSVKDLPGLDELKAAGLLDPSPMASVVEPAVTPLEAAPLEVTPLEVAPQEDGGAHNDD